MTTNRSNDMSKEAINNFAAAVCGLPQGAWREVPALSPTQTYINAIKHECPSAADIELLCTALHAAMVDADVPELLWTSLTFEDMSDALVVAGRCVDREQT